MKKQIIILAFCVTAVIYCQQGKNSCLQMKDCGSCLRAGGDCAFCKDQDFGKGNSRCDKAQNLEKNKCKVIMNIQGTVSETNNNNFEPTVQVRPQKVTLNLRPGQIKQFKLRIKPAKNFPAHLYYLMDMSKSMEDDLLKLRTLGEQIAKGISSVTTNYKLAFGSFVDKTVAPFIQLGKLDEPCELEDGTKCVKTFDYRHIFDFSNNTQEFENAVKQQKISGNLDTPEGGFDALMQVVMCTTILKWEPVEKARRIVVFVTDASPHIAGDGRIGGIIAPNDAECHLSKVGKYFEYSKANNLDYPSLSLLKEKLAENSIIPIMAVTGDVKSIYDKITVQWKDFKAVAGTLEKDSSNIVTLIKEKYSEIIRTLAPTLRTSLKGVVVNFRSSKCENPAVVSDDGKVCSGIVDGEEYVFDVSISARECPKNPKEKRTFIIDSGFGKVEVDLTMICDCECETQLGESNSPKCSGKGTFKCGICYCDENRFGDQCHCDENSQADDSLCKKDNNTDVVCSTHGSCICGECQCTIKPYPEVISGKFCQCNNFGCPQYNGKVCGGETRGTCDCGVCKCKGVHLGDNCGGVNCTLASKQCENGGKVCGGNGDCKCAQCVCNKGYGGPFCEECVSCPSKCSIYKNCVQCKIWNEGELAEKGCAGCDDLDIVKVNKTGEADCEYKEGRCWFKFDIRKEGGNDTIYVQAIKDCLQFIPGASTNITAIVLGIIGGLILLALILLLLWKLLITAYDNYEYQKFLKENRNPIWSNTNNPIYKPSQTNYQNPTYAGK